MQAELAAQSANPSRSGGLKGRLRRALSFNAAQTLKEEAEAEVEAEAAEKKEKEQRRMDGEDVDDDDVSIKASQINGKLKAKATPIKVKTEEDIAGSPQTTIPPKKKGRAASLFNSRLNASTDNISLSSTVSSASVMIRKLGAMGKLARRNSLAGITSLFKDKDKNKNSEGESSSKEKGKKKDKSAKGNAAQASVSLVTAELDRAGASGDWSVSAGEMNGLSPAAKLARQHTLKSNAEAAEARAREAREREAAREREREEAEAREAARAVLANGVTQVPTWDRNTATRSPVKGGGGGGMRINEDGTRTFIEDEDEDESEDGHYQRFQQQQQQGWDDDEDWDGDGDEDATIRVGIQPRSSSDTGRSSSSGTDEEHEPWAVDVRRSVERTRQPARGILKRAESYDQQVYLHEQHSAPTQRVRSNSYNSPSQSELGPLARIPSPDPDHIDGLHRHGSHSAAHGQSTSVPTHVLPPLSFDSGSPLSTTFDPSITSKDLPATPSTVSTSTSTSIFSTSTSFTTVSASTPTTTHTENRTSQIFQHPNFNSSAPALASSFGSKPPTLTHRSATSPSKRLTFATNLSVYDTFSASVYDRRSEPATWSRLTPALAQRIKEELNSYKMEEMEVHAASRIQ